MMTGLIQDQNLEKQIEKQIGCMSGFLHIFDRQQILAGKRVYSTKRLPASPVGSPESVKSVTSVKSPAKRETEKPVPLEPAVTTIPESPDRFKKSPVSSNAFPATTPPRSPLPLPIFELKEGSMKNSWKFCKEMPRLSLDSRATVDSKGSLRPREIRPESVTNSGNDEQRRSPSVIARLMGLEQLPCSDSPENVKKPELRRSASESRVSRDLFHSRFMDMNNVNNVNNIQTNKQLPETNLINNTVRDVNSNRNRNGYSNRNVQNGRVMESMKYSTRNQKSEASKASHWTRRSFFDSADIFPERKQSPVPVYGDFEKNLKLKGIDEQSKDLETLKHILEALQFKGLLHSKTETPSSYGYRNFVYDPSFLFDDVNTVHMKPLRSPVLNRRFGGVNRYSGEISPSVSPRKDRGAIDRSGRSPVRARNSPALNSKNENGNGNGNTIVKRKPLSIETERRLSCDPRRISPSNSPKLTPKRSTGSDHYSVNNNRSPRSNRSPEPVYSKQKVTRNIHAEDETSSFSESSGSSTSHSDPERLKIEENGKSLLARCDKLLNSIAEMNSITESHTSFNSVIPSPVSVLDSAFDKDESSSPSPVMKRCIDFKDLNVDLEDHIWRSIISPSNSTKDDELFISEDSDFTYISEILRASKYLSDESAVFYFLEKQQYLNNNESSNGSKLRRKLVFDIVGEIIEKNKDLPPWISTDSTNPTNSIKQICVEFQKIREPETAGNLLDPICTDLAGNNGWGDQPMEVAEAVLCIERLIFKDLVSETIRDLAEFAGKNTVFAPRRKLVF